METGLLITFAGNFKQRAALAARSGRGARARAARGRIGDRSAGGIECRCGGDGGLGALLAQARATALVTASPYSASAALHERPARGRAFIPLATCNYPYTYRKMRMK